MMDFYRLVVNEKKGGSAEVVPDFIVGPSKDLMIRGGNFYAIWNEETGLWETDKNEAARLIDARIAKRIAEQQIGAEYRNLTVKKVAAYRSQLWTQFNHYMKSLGDNYHQLDLNLTFANDEVKKTDYVSRRLSYALEPGDYSAWDELVGTLYSIEDREKIEWAIGSVVSGDSKKIQKFFVFYGSAGTGKSTILNIIEKLFEGYVGVVDAKALGNAASFAMETLRGNPLVAIQHDASLIGIRDNSMLNAIVAHELLPMNEKYKSTYKMRLNALLFMGTNQPVKITDAKSGLIRRLIDIEPTGALFPINHYNTLMSQIDFELGAIAYHCLQVYQQLGKNYYNAYKPLTMMYQTDVFYNFIEANFDVFSKEDFITLKQAWALYNEWAEDANIQKKMQRHQFRTELQNYFDEFIDRITVDGQEFRSVFQGFRMGAFKSESKKDENAYSLVMDEKTSLLDEVLAEMPAQYGDLTADGHIKPEKRWSRVRTKLKDLDTTQLHYVQVPLQHIVIDFDLKDLNGYKSLDRNLEAASNWPPTYAEISQGGSGVHLHYVYQGDVEELSSIFSDGIEVKTLLGDASLRRRVTRCNSIPVATLPGGLPVKEKKKMLEVQTIKSEKGLRDLIARNLRKEIHPGTKPSVDFIKKILDDAYESGMHYDVTDLRGTIVAFANNSTNQPFESLKIVQQMKFQSAENAKMLEEAKDTRLVFFDVEVYPNLFVVCWKYEGDAQVVKMINPRPLDVEGLFQFKLVGFNNRRYDNHILYARFMGYDNESLFKLSQKLVANDRNSPFGEAYNVSYTDVWDFSSKKQGLKRFQIELGLPHKELNLPWDQPVPDDRIQDVLDYCANDVETTEAVFVDRMQDYVARQILASLSGLTMNDTTQRHTARIIFGTDRNPQAEFVYTDLRKDFPGYEFDQGKSTYRDELVGEGGYVYAEPGMYENVAVLDIASMHPTSIEQLNLFGPYTPQYSALKEARLAIKRGDYEAAKKMMGGKLTPFLNNPEEAIKLAYALKIVINIVYGLTSAKFENPFRDVRNKDNIVAKRGALFMIDLKHMVQEQGYQVVHIKTDSIKIPNADKKIIDFVIEYGNKWGYHFENEGIYDKFCLVNDAVYVAKKNGVWEAVGAQFQHPVVFKTLFQQGDPVIEDYFEMKSVMQGAMYLDFETDVPMALTKGLIFVGSTGLFVPVTKGGADLYRIKDDKYYLVTGTKGYKWIEAHVYLDDPKKWELDSRYYDKLVEDAFITLNKFGEVDWLLS